jgi:hypothetical protein
MKKKKQFHHLFQNLLELNFWLTVCSKIEAKFYSEPDPHKNDAALKHWSTGHLRIIVALVVGRFVIHILVIQRIVLFEIGHSEIRLW